MPQVFESLDIADDVRKLIDLKHRVIVYSGFFVVGNHMPEETWHVDYLEGANAFTLIAPLFELDGRMATCYTATRSLRHGGPVSAR